MLLKVYAKCIHDAEANALQRMWEATLWNIVALERMVQPARLEPA